jgi:serine/threonine protein kinase
MAQPSPPAAPSQTQLLQDPQDHYELKKVLGRGSFGAVYVAVRKADNEEVAVKRLEVIQFKLRCELCFSLFVLLLPLRRCAAMGLFPFFFFFFFSVATILRAVRRTCRDRERLLLQVHSLH